RREQALLRARGVTAPRLVRLGVMEAAVVGASGGAAGLGLARLVGRLAFQKASFGATPGVALGWALAAAGVGLVIAVVTLVVPAWRDARALTVAAGRRPVGRARRPGWLRAGRDLWLLGGP